jgi:hypothetical protein
MPFNPEFMLAQQEGIAFLKKRSTNVEQDGFIQPTPYNRGGLTYQDSALIQAAIEKFKLQQEKQVTTPPQPETILGNGLTNSQKWTWVIGLTLAAYGLIYWSQKQPNK